jgi:hypothetical protein
VYEIEIFKKKLVNKNDLVQKTLTPLPPPPPWGFQPSMVSQTSFLTGLNENN